MFTQCPQCKSRFEIGASQLRHGLGLAKCGPCGAAFNALENLSDNLEESIETPNLPVLGEKAVLKPKTADYKIDAPLPWEKPSSPRTAGLWCAGILALIFLFGAQVVFFKGERLTRESRLRPWLTALCERLGCNLPPYREIRAIDILDRSLSPAEDGRLEFRAILVNQAEFSQALPALRLTLLAFNGEALARRTFNPKEYVAEIPTPQELPVGHPLKARLLIAKPSSEVAGYVFELM